MLFIEHVNVVLQKLRQDPISSLSTDTTTEAYRAQIAVNRAIARVWNHKSWSFKSRSDTLALTASTASYPLPKLVGEPYSTISSLHPYKVFPISKHLFDLYVPNPTATGNPYFMILSEMRGVTTQLSSASTIGAVSSSASDTTQKVLVKGIVSGEEDYEELTLNGTTQVTTTKSFSSIQSITKSATTAGRVTITSTGDSSTLLVLSPIDQTARLRQATFYPTPSASATITIHHFRLPPFLTHAYEDHQIPRRWDYVVDQWAYALALQAKGQDQLAEFQNQIALATKMLEEDMASEEIISIEEPVLPLKAGEGGFANQLMAPPSGTSFVD